MCIFGNHQLAIGMLSLFTSFLISYSESSQGEVVTSGFQAHSGPVSCLSSRYSEVFLITGTRDKVTVWERSLLLNKREKWAISTSLPSLPSSNITVTTYLINSFLILIRPQISIPWYRIECFKNPKSSKSLRDPCFLPHPFPPLSLRVWQSGV